jgi:hypothetical protein
MTATHVVILASTASDRSGSSAATYGRTHLADFAGTLCGRRTDYLYKSWEIATVRGGAEAADCERCRKSAGLASLRNRGA